MDLFQRFLDAVKSRPQEAPEEVTTPEAVSQVEGFEISIEKKEGVLLKSRPEGQPEAKAKDASAPYYFEVKINVTGENPEYPAEEKPWVQNYTVGTDDRGSGFNNGVSYIPAGSQWTKFELVEEYDDGKIKPNVIFMGKKMPAHHGVMLRAHFRDAVGNESKMELGGWVRKSERESEAWKRAARSNVFYM